jgi:hypothetical protein
MSTDVNMRIIVLFVRSMIVVCERGGVSIMHALRT